MTKNKEKYASEKEAKKQTRKEAKEKAMRKKQRRLNASDKEKVEMIAQLAKTNCVDLALLDEKLAVIDHDIEWLAAECGMTYETLNNKLHGKTKFYVEEMAMLYPLVGLDVQDVYDIFIHPFWHRFEEEMMKKGMLFI